MTYIHGHRRRKDGVSRASPTHNSWRCMMRRCYEKTEIGYHRYGGRGIRVCKRWHQFPNFLKDMDVRPEGKTLDRINNAKSYSPQNCRWATRREQSKFRRTTRFITYKGKTLCLKEWEIKLGVPTGWLARRLKQGWSTQRALSTPKKRYAERNKRARATQGASLKA